jgi:hypothetical protein
MVSRDSFHLNGHRRLIPRTGACCETSVLVGIFGALAEGGLSLL